MLQIMSYHSSLLAACVLNRLHVHVHVGSDPPGIKLRAAKALEAVDYFVPGYWVFSKLVQSLADIGYDNNNLVCVQLLFGCYFLSFVCFCMQHVASWCSHWQTSVTTTTTWWVAGG